MSSNDTPSIDTSAAAPWWAGECAGTQRQPAAPVVEVHPHAGADLGDLERGVLGDETEEALRRERGDEQRRAGRDPREGVEVEVIGSVGGHRDPVGREQRMRWRGGRWPAAGTTTPRNAPRRVIHGSMRPVVPEPTTRRPRVTGAVTSIARNLPAAGLRGRASRAYVSPYPTRAVLRIGDRVRRSTRVQHASRRRTRSERPWHAEWSRRYPSGMEGGSPDEGPLATEKRRISTGARTLASRLPRWRRRPRAARRRPKRYPECCERRRRCRRPGGERKRPASRPRWPSARLPSREARRRDWPKPEVVDHLYRAAARPLGSRVPSGARGRGHRGRERPGQGCRRGTRRCSPTRAANGLRCCGR